MKIYRSESSAKLVKEDNSWRVLVNGVPCFHSPKKAVAAMFFKAYVMSAKSAVASYMGKIGSKTGKCKVRGGPAYYKRIAKLSVAARKRKKLCKPL